MCQFISFLHRPDNGDVAVWNLTGHSETQEKLRLKEPLWCEGHYLPNGEVICRVTNKNWKTEKECAERMKNRFPTFNDFLLWCLDGRELSGSLDLSLLTTLDPKVKLPTTVGDYLDLSSLTTLDPKVKLPTTVGDYLDLSLLTTLDPKVKLPTTVGGSLDLSSLTTLDPKVKLPTTVGGYLDLRSLTTLDPKVKLPTKCGYLYLRSGVRKEYERLRGSKTE